MKKKPIIITAIIIVVAVGIYAYFNFGQIMDLAMKMTSSMKHRDPTKEKAAFTLSADDLANAYKNNKDDANTKYLNKSVLVEGTVTGVQGVTVSFNNVACNVDSTEISKITAIKTGDKVKLQGLVVGYNDLLDEIDLAQCAVK